MIVLSLLSKIPLTVGFLEKGYLIYFYLGTFSMSHRTFSEKYAHIHIITLIEIINPRIIITIQTYCI